MVEEAWVSLGVLYAEQGRNSEALGYYEKALEVREKSPGTSPIRVAMLLNNIANCQRRSRDFGQALRLIAGISPSATCRSQEVGHADQS